MIIFSKEHCNDSSANINLRNSLLNYVSPNFTTAKKKFGEKKLKEKKVGLPYMGQHACLI